MDTSPPEALLEELVPPDTISAEELHRFLLRTHRVSAQLRLRFLAALRALDAGRLYFSLGFSSSYAYAERYFGYSRSQTHTSLRVAEALETLTRCAKAFSEGELSWSALREIARVADAETEEEWLAFALEKTIHEVHAEVKDALKAKRKRPRKGRYGLPHLTVHLSMDLEPEENELVARVLDVASREAAPKLGLERLPAKDSLVYLARCVLEGRVPGESLEAGAPEGVAPSERSGAVDTILYHQCPDCRRSRVMTEAGPVEVDPEVVSRVEGEAEKVTISPEEELVPELPLATEAPPDDVPRDRPNPKALVHKVRLRDGRRCTNPHCGQTRALHSHHIVFRSEGGRTEIHNETLSCPICHALIHTGLLRIEGSPLEELRWIPASAAIDAAIARERLEQETSRELESLPVVRVVAAAEPAEAGATPAPSSEFTMWTPGRDAEAAAEEAYPFVVQALRQLGWTESQARGKVVKALGGGSYGQGLTEESRLLDAALRC